MRSRRQVDGESDARRINGGTKTREKDGGWREEGSDEKEELYEGMKMDNVM